MPKSKKLKYPITTQARLNIPYLSVPNPFIKKGIITIANSIGIPYSSDQYNIATSINGSTISYTISSVPIPSALLLLGSGLLGLVGLRRKKMS